jgi:hypothetical protein
MLKRIFLVLIVLCGLGVFENHATAQARDGWLVDLEPMWMSVKGFDQHTGDIVRTTTVLTTNPVRLTESVTRQPILNRMESGLKFRGAIQYRWQGWGAGVSGWSFNSDNAITGSVTSLGDTGSLIFGTSGISMWRENVDPAENDTEPSGLSPIQFHSNTGLKTYAVDIFVLRTLTSPTNPNRLDLIIGAKTGRMKTTQNQGFSERAFVFDFFQPGVHLNNVITLASDAQAKFVGTGPLIGIEGQTSWRRLGIAAGITEALLIGNARQQGVMTDTDDITIARSATGPFLPCPTSLLSSGCVPVRSEINFSTSPTVYVPMAEARLRLQFDLADHVSLSGQGFTAIWGNAPVPPAFTITHAFASGSSSPGLDWALEQQTLRFAGAGIAVTVHF